MSEKTVYTGLVNMHAFSSPSLHNVLLKLFHLQSIYSYKCFSYLSSLLFKCSIICE